MIWGADGQLLPSAVVTLQGSQPSFLDLNGHKVTLGKVVLSKAASIRLGKGGTLQVKQLHCRWQAAQGWRLYRPRSPGLRERGR